MSNVIVNQSPAEINGQHQTNQDQAIVLLAKLKVLLDLGAAYSPETFTKANMHNYLWVLSDLVEQLEEVMI
jgi:hypothetical protein